MTVATNHVELRFPSPGILVPATHDVPFHRDLCLSADPPFWISKTTIFDSRIPYFLYQRCD
jgi:hypothetical protein